MKTIEELYNEINASEELKKAALTKSRLPATDLLRGIKQNRGIEATQKNKL